MKMFLDVFMLLNFFLSISAEKESKRSFLLDLAECVEDCQSPLVEVVNEIFEGLEEDLQNQIIETAQVNFTLIPVPQLLGIFNTILDKETFCVEGVNENLHRLFTCNGACSSVKSCDYFEPGALVIFEANLEQFICDSEDVVQECDGLEIAFEEVNSGVGQGLGLIAMITAVLAAVATQH
eukprot:snap_masked-scaffold_10-processed-gene-4.40-mRNA-1 protein AED:1.00 eAED:1.00 QI:0/-1/0/0/-1/1/1/0/179